MKRYYQIGEVASMLKILPGTIDTWEDKIGKLHTKKGRLGRGKKGRLFTYWDIERIKKIISLKETGFYTLKGIKHFIS